MPKFKNVSPLGALELPLVGRVVEAGEVVDVPADRAVFLAGQVETWEPADAEAEAIMTPVAPAGDPDASTDDESGKNGGGE